MSCEICGRGACTRTFHSIAEQEAFDSEAGAAERAMFDKIADLELTCRAQIGAITALRAQLDQEREKVARVENVRDYWCNEAKAALSDAADLTLELEHLRPEGKALEAKAEAWERDALRYAQNADFWRAALDQERADNERLRAAAHSAADCIVHALYNEDGLCSSIGEPALDELESVGVVSALLSGRGEGGNDG